MNEYNEVVSSIVQHIIIRLLPMVLCSIALLVIVIMAVKYKIFTRKAFGVVAIWFLIVVVYILYKFGPLYWDIKNTSYIIYNGSFEYIDDFNKNSDQVILSNGLRLYSEGIDLDSGNYSGELIYCKNAKWVLEIDVTTNELF